MSVTGTFVDITIRPADDDVGVSVQPDGTIELYWASIPLVVLLDADDARCLTDRILEAIHAGKYD